MVICKNAITSITPKIPTTNKLIAALQSVIHCFPFLPAEPTGYMLYCILSDILHRLTYCYVFSLQCECEKFSQFPLNGRIWASNGWFLTFSRILVFPEFTCAFAYYLCRTLVIYRISRN